MLRGIWANLVIPILVLALVFGLNGTAKALISFDFNSPNLNLFPGQAANIEEYMEGLYPSNITVRHAIVGDGIPHGPLHDEGLGDFYIQNAPGVVNWFSITFDIPITYAEFDWGMISDEFNAYFSTSSSDIFNSSDPAGSGFTLFFHENFTLSNKGTTSKTFGAPVYTLAFRDSLAGEIEIDNLKVKTVPEPCTLILVVSGLIGLVGYGRFKHKKKH